MSCNRCASGKLKDFTAEIAIHRPGWEGLNKPLLRVFPTLTVCLDCGFTEFVIPKDQREELSNSRKESMARILPEVW
jgi:hypothetical protein